MAKDTYWLKWDANIFDDPKIIRLRKKFGWEGFGVYTFICCMLRQQENYKYKYSDLDVLSEDKKIENINMIVDYCISVCLFKKEGDFFWSDRLLKDAEYKTKVARENASKRWDKNKQSKDGLQQEKETLTKPDFAN